MTIITMIIIIIITKIKIMITTIINMITERQ